MKILEACETYSLRLNKLRPGELIRKPNVSRRAIGFGRGQRLREQRLRGKGECKADYTKYG